MADFQQLSVRAGRIYGLDTDSALMEVGKILTETLDALAELEEQVERLMKKVERLAR